MPDSGVSAACSPGDIKRWSKIRKSGPFKLSKITDQYPFYSWRLAEEIQKIDELPDFSEDTRILVMSDYGGEHETAAFNTYAFLICSFDKSSVFQHETNSLREAHGLNSPFHEFAYKKLKCGPKY